MKFLITYIFSISLFCANAQRLPRIQQKSIQVPENVKIDGKATEWNNQFQAYNNATDVFYTLANDDDNLYLVVQITDPDVINKVISGGIKLTIQKKIKSFDKSAKSVTYPVTTNKNTTYFILKDNKHSMIDNSIKTADSITDAHNKILAEKCKWIETNGFPGLDTLISVYNTDGIKAACLFDNKKTYTCELSIKLNLLGLSVNDSVKFSYQILLSGLHKTITIHAAGESDPSDAMKNFVATANAIAAQQSSPTDFWGEYTLAKKP